MAPANMAMGIGVLMAIAAIVGFVAGYGLRSYISYRRHQKFGRYPRPRNSSDASD